MHRFYEQHCARWGPWGSSLFRPCEQNFEALARLKDQLVLFSAPAVTRRSGGMTITQDGPAGAATGASRESIVFTEVAVAAWWVWTTPSSLLPPGTWLEALESSASITLYSPRAGSPCIWA